MSMLSSCFQNAFRIVSRHKILTFFMVILTAICLHMFGLVQTQSVRADANTEELNEAYGQTRYYRVVEDLSDFMYISYIREDGTEVFEHLNHFMEMLYNEESFTFVSLSEQIAQFIDFAPPSVVLDSYENGIPENSIFKYEGHTYYSAKQLIVSQSFFETSSIEAKEGRLFTDDEYIYQENQPIPVLLGSAYEGVFALGDRFEARSLYDSTEYEVVGFLGDDAFFYAFNKGQMVSCERYIVVPAFRFKHTDVSKVSDNARVVLLVDTYGYIISNKDYEEATTRYLELLENADLGDWNMHVQDPDETYNMNNLIDEYSAMTKEVSQQFRNLLVIIIVLTVLSISFVLSGFIREQHLEFGIRLLCGAPMRNVAGDIIFLSGGILLIGDFLASLFLFMSGVRGMSLLLVQSLTMVLWVVVCIYPIIRLWRIDISDIIGGKE